MSHFFLLCALPSGHFFFCRPSGSAKSTDLVQTALEEYQDQKEKGEKSGLLLLRARNDAPPDTSGVPSTPEYRVAVISRNLLEQMGCSPRPSLLEHFVSRGIKFRNVVIKEEEKAATERLSDAFKDLYGVAAALGLKTKRPSIILADEFHDLAKTSAGRDVFNEALNHAVVKSADFTQALVWTVFTNSDGDRSLVAHQKGKVRLRFQPDPPLEEVRSALLTKGYSAQQADDILLVCGTRRRLLAPFLDASRDQIQSATWVRQQLSDHNEMALTALVALQDRVAPSEETLKMGAVLDKLTSDTSNPTGLRKSDLPAPYRSPFPSAVLYQGKGEMLFFQSQAVRHCWEKHKSEFPGLSAPPQPPQQPLK